MTLKRKEVKIKVSKTNRQQKDKTVSKLKGTAKQKGSRIQFLMQTGEFFRTNLDENAKITFQCEENMKP